MGLTCPPSPLLLSPLGATCILRPKFSVSQFWDDCRRYHVSVIQYVGEVMRYLCNAPKVTQRLSPGSGDARLSLVANLNGGGGMKQYGVRYVVLLLLLLLIQDTNTAPI